MVDKYDSRTFGHGIVAVKRTKFAIPRLVTNDSTLLRRLHSLAREITIMSLQGLRSHENIIKLFGWDWFEDWQDEETNRGLSPALVMEFAELGTLRRFLLETTVSPSQKLSLSFQVALGLDAIHKSGVIHGDVKQENVLICRKSATEVTPKITDFGNSLLLESANEIGYNCTLEYRAPELLKHSTLITPSNLILCDIFSYGLLVWEVLLDGRHYYECADFGPNEDISEQQTMTDSMIEDSIETDVEESDFDSVDFHMSDACEVSFNNRNKMLQFSMKAAKECDELSMEAEKDKFTEVFLQTLQEDPRMRVQSLSEVISILAAEEETGSSIG